jgi:hypothetical protein
MLENWAKYHPTCFPNIHFLTGNNRPKVAICLSRPDARNVLGVDIREEEVGLFVTHEHATG